MQRDNKTVVISARVTKDVRKRLHDLADAEERTVANYLHLLITRAIAAEGKKR